MEAFKRLPPFRLQTQKLTQASRQSDNKDDSSLPLFNAENSNTGVPRSPRTNSSSDDEYDDKDDAYPESNPSSAAYPQRNWNTVSLLPTTMASRTSRYHIPGRFIRYLCLLLALAVIAFMGVLVHASIEENNSLANGTHKAQLEKLPTNRPKLSPPPKNIQDQMLADDTDVWNIFPLLTRYYGGLKTLRPFGQVEPEFPMFEKQEPETPKNPETPEAPKAAESRDVPTSHAFDSDALHFNDQKECYLDAAGHFKVPPLHVYDGRPHGFPDHATGSYEVLSLPENICLDRYGRYGPYGFGYSIREGGLGAGEYGDVEGMDSVWKQASKVNWHNTDWADAQRRCYKANLSRFNTTEQPSHQPNGFFIGATDQQQKSASTGKLSRTAVVIRCWDEYNWTPNDIMNLRAIISELSLASGGQYDVHLLVQVKDEAAHPIWADDSIYKQRIIDTVPKEFQGISTLWTETEMLALYQGLYDDFPKGKHLPIHGVYRGLLMPLQLFANRHPEYEHFWQWEMDLYYIGHYLDFFRRIEDWSRDQPRKGLWERNARYYVPTVHGSWQNFSEETERQTTQGVSGPGERMIWGPEHPQHKSDLFETEEDPVPPSGQDDTWGVGEEADLITLSPIFDPEGTYWGGNDITGYNKDKGFPPRRAFVTVAGRMSRRLLNKMHRETALKKHFAFAEMWPGTVALHHGYKAVHAPQPIYVDRAWSLPALASTINGGRNGASGGASSSVFGNKEGSLETMSYFYRSEFVGNLYRQFIGLQSKWTSGQQFETKVDESKNGQTIDSMKGGEGRMCLPPMLLHPVKGIEIPVEAPPAKAKTEEEFDAGS
ncbi:hypothetical protein CFIMG_007576RA00001 [Ceratocystis fimbriata CBS 114723]|uniref:Major facilitator superfamily transporter n=1 Tax=Ceratocystis fimbriata CBS 114723 TaxID=1035309 RepID=A0A2C5XEC0_9PEZI|nr:hypothetical protein CFIMG_007576RA00001 [Ceratocystis fimbriata CBS 114723]